MVVKNAAVDAGGGHEGLIGLGFAVGPLAGLAGTRLAPAAGSLFWGTTIAIAPVFLVCAAGALLPILKTSNRPLQAKQAGTRTPREEGAPRA
jgi:hypothetical protein